MTALRIVYMGTPLFAVPALQALHQSDHHIIGVVTQPDRPVGRGYKLSPSAVKLAALEYHIPILQPEKLRRNDEFQQHLQELAPDVVVVAAYGKILPQAVLDTPRLGCINIHASLLPRHRGAAPISAAILAGDKETGITIMLMDAGMDTGPMLARRSLPIGPTTLADELGQRLAQLGSGLLLECLDPWVKGELKPEPQDAALATYAPLVKKGDGLADWQQPADQLERRWRAYYPWPGLYTYHRDRLLKLQQVAVSDQDGTGEPGEIIAVGGDGIVVRCGRQSLLLQQVQPAGGRIMPAGDFARGAHLEAGDKLTGPPAMTGISGT